MAFNLSKAWNDRKDRLAREREETERMEQDKKDRKLLNTHRQKEHYEAAANEAGIIAQMDEALKAGANINTRDHLGWSALDRCTIWGYVEAAKFLVARGAELSETCIQQSAAFRDFSLLKLFFDNGATGKETRGDRSLLSYTLYSKESDTPERTASQKACVELLLEKGQTFTPEDAGTVFQYSPQFIHYFPGLAEAKALQESAKTGDLPKVKELLAQGTKADSAAADYGSDAALLFAAKNNDIPMIEALCEAGADPNLVSPPSDQTPLQAAVDNGHMEAFQKLWELGGNPNFSGSKTVSAAWAAARKGPEWEALAKKIVNDEATIMKKKTTVFKPLSFKTPMLRE